MRNLVCLLIFVMIYSCGLTRFSDTWENEFIGSRTDVPLYPEGNANYWSYTLQNDLEYTYVVKGKLPNLRYLSFNLYDDKTRSSLSSMVDNDLISDNGNDYELYILPIGSNKYEGKNRMFYDPEMKSSSVFLRYYMPSPQPYGAELLPTIEAYDKSGKKQKLPHRFFNRLGSKSLYKILAKVIESKIDDKFFQEPVKVIDATKSKGAGLYENKDNSYIVCPLTIEENEVGLLKFKAPKSAKSYNDTDCDLRYWSFSIGDAKTYNFTSMNDNQFKVAQDGFVYIAVGKNLRNYENSKYNLIYMQNDADPNVILLYRHLLPSKDFKYAIQNIPQGGKAQDYIGDYAPSGKVVKLNRN
jgi:hypothetical protein